MAPEPSDRADLLAAARDLAMALTPADLDLTLDRITRAAVTMLPQVEMASITVRHADGRLETLAPTDPLIVELDARQYELREGPCYEAATDTVHVVCGDLAGDARFPRYGPVAAEAGIRSQAGIRLYDAPGSYGALNLYSRRAGALAEVTDLEALFASQAGMAIAYAHEIQDLNDAMHARRTVGQAVGIIMQRYQMTDDRSFALLTRLGELRGVTLHLVAQEIVAGADAFPED